MTSIKDISPGDLAPAASTPQAFPLGSPCICYFGGSWYPGIVSEHVRGGRSIGVSFVTGSGRERTSRVSVVHLEPVLAAGGAVQALRVAPLPARLGAPVVAPIVKPAALAPKSAPAPLVHPSAARAARRALASPAAQAVAASAGVAVADLSGETDEEEPEQSVNEAADQAQLDQAALDVQEACRWLEGVEVHHNAPAAPTRACKSWYVRLSFKGPMPAAQALTLGPWLLQGLKAAGIELASAPELIEGDSDSEEAAA